MSSQAEKSKSLLSQIDKFTSTTKSATQLGTEAKAWCKQHGYKPTSGSAGTRHWIKKFGGCFASSFFLVKELLLTHIHSRKGGLIVSSKKFIKKMK